MEDRNVDNFLINKTDRKTINNIFLSAFFYPHIKNLNFVTFHNRQMWGVNSNPTLVDCPADIIFRVVEKRLYIVYW